MKINCESINHYLKWMREGQHFALAGLSDAEWFCILNQREGTKTGLGQVISRDHGKRLFDVIKRRHRNPWFMFAIPKCLRDVSGFDNGQIDWFLGRNDIDMVGWERDMVTDDLAREAGLYPLIRLLHGRPVCIIGNRDLRKLKPLVVDYRHFVEISSPNLHMEHNGIEIAVEKARQWGTTIHSNETVYLVSAGVSATVIIDQLYDTVPPAWFIDCGSIWDAFVGIGGQREWRAELYKDQAKWDKWKFDNLNGKDGRGW